MGSAFTRVPAFKCGKPFQTHLYRNATYMCTLAQNLRSTDFRCTILHALSWFSPDERAGCTLMIFPLMRGQAALSWFSPDERAGCTFMVFSWWEGRLHFHGFSVGAVYPEFSKIMCKTFRPASREAVRFYLYRCCYPLCFCVCFRRGHLVSSVKSVTWCSATNQRSALTTTRRMLRATPERRRRDQSILTLDTSARFAARSLVTSVIWVDIWQLFIALMALDTSARFAARTLVTRVIWVDIWELFTVLVASTF